MISNVAACHLFLHPPSVMVPYLNRMAGLRVRHSTAHRGRGTKTACSCGHVIPSDTIIGTFLKLARLIRKGNHARQVI